MNGVICHWGKSRHKFSCLSGGYRTKEAITMNKKLLFTFSLFVICVLSWPLHAAVNPSTASGSITAGLAQLAKKTPAGLIAADKYFAQALAVDPSNDEALVLKCFSGLALIQGSSSFTKFLSSIGVTCHSPSLYNLNNGAYTTKTDAYGNSVYAGNMTGLVSYFDTTLRPQLVTAISQLSRVSNKVNFTLTQQQAGFFPLSIDYGDVQLTLCALHLAQSITYISDSYNLNILVNDVAKLLNGELTFQELLATYPQVMTFSSNNQNRQALQSFTNANSALQSAYQFIISKRVNDFSYPNLFAIDDQDPATMSSFQSTARRFAAVAASIDSPQTFPADSYDPTILDGTRIYLGSLLTSSSSPRSWLGLNSFWGDLYNPGTLLSTTFSGVLPQMTDDSVTSYLRNIGWVHEIIPGAGITANEQNKRFFTGQTNYYWFTTDGVVLGGTYTSGINSFSTTSYSFLWDGTTYSSLDYPMAQETQILGMTNGIAWGAFMKGSLQGAFLYQSNSFVTVNFPGSLSTSIERVSGNNVAGSYTTSLHQHGLFFFNGTKYQDISIKSAWSSYILGIKGSNVWGAYYDKNGQHAFWFNGSKNILISPPKAVSSTIYGIVGGKIIGAYNTKNETKNFVYSNGNYTALNYPGSTSTYINWDVSGDLVSGSYEDNSQIQHGFTYDGTNFASISYPGADWSYASGGSGKVCWGSAGFWDSATEMFSQVLFVCRNGSFSLIPLDISGNNYGYISAVSGNCVLGTYSTDDGLNKHNFFYNGKTITTIDYPGAEQTYINSFGTNWILGNYYNTQESGNFAYWLGSSTNLSFFSSQSIKFTLPSSVVYGSGAVPLNGYASSGLPVSYSVVSGPASVLNSNLSIFGTGTVTVVAKQLGNSQYSAAAPVTNNVTVVKGAHYISFTLPSTQTFIQYGNIPLTGTDTAALPITYTSGNTNILAISGTNAVMKSRGKTTLTASQPGNSNYNAATNVVRTITLK